MVVIPAGVYRLGVSDEEIRRYFDALHLNPGVAATKTAGYGVGPAGRRNVSRLPTQHEVKLEAYYILEHEVTNWVYRQYVREGGHEPAAHSWEQWDKSGEQFGDEMLGALHDWRDGSYPPGRAQFPVMGIGVRDAQGFCLWMSRRTGVLHRLPTEQEWERAYRGKDSYLFPWGDFWDATLIPCVSRDRWTGPSPVWSCGDETLRGVMNLLGNVREWTWDASVNLPIVRGLCFADQLQDFVPAGERMRSSLGEYTPVGFRYVIPVVDGKLVKYVDSERNESK